MVPTHPQQRTSLKYRPEIDGLRALAVLPVILFHAKFEAFKGGFTGVDIFFVISGYLITSILCREIKNKEFSYLNFYERRARRILPALFLVLFACLPFAWLWLLPVDLVDFCQSLIGVSLYSSNVLFWLESGYWETASELKPLLHTWSLAVEEQYYIFFPILLTLLFKFWQKGIGIVLIVGAVLSLALSHWLAYQSPSANFFLLPSRAWELAIGAIVAVYSQPGKILARDSNQPMTGHHALSMLGLVLILISISVIDEETPFPSAYALLPTVGTALIIIYSSPHNLLGKTLSLAPFRFIGLISYSAYLWHQPIFAFARHRLGTEPSPSLYLILSIASLILAYLSWRFFEKPFRTKQKIGRKSILLFTIAGTTILLVIGLAGSLSEGYKSRSVYQSLLVKDFEPENDLLQEEAWTFLRDLVGDQEYSIEDNRLDLEPWFEDSDARKKLLVVGNSHAKDLFLTLNFSETAKNHFQIARFGTQIHQLANDNHPFYTSPNFKECDLIIICSRYSKKDIPNIPKVLRNIRKYKPQVAITLPSYRFTTVNQKTIADSTVREATLSSPKLSELEVEELSRKINHAYYLDYKMGNWEPQQLTAIKTISTSAEELGGITILNRMDYSIIEKSETALGTSPTLEKYYYDYGHYTIAGCEAFGKAIDQSNWLSPLILE